MADRVSAQVACGERLVAGHLARQPHLAPMEQVVAEERNLPEEQAVITITVPPAAMRDHRPLQPLVANFRVALDTEELLLAVVDLVAAVLVMTNGVTAAVVAAAAVISAAVAAVVANRIISPVVVADLATRVVSRPAPQSVEAAITLVTTPTANTCQGLVSVELPIQVVEMAAL